MTQFIPVSVTSRREVAADICEFVLHPQGGEPLPDAQAGAHIGVEAPNKAMRQYSLVRPGPAPDTYTIAVKREANGRGGSDAMHTVQVGDVLNILPPVNDFPLGDAPSYFLIAGGIGVTPIYSMAQELVERGGTLRMIYCARSAEDAAYVPELEALLGDRLTVHYDGGDLAQVYDFWDDFVEPSKEHVYCCGPGPLMEEIKGISGHWPDGAVHFEDFAGVAVTRDDDAPFDVTLQKSGQTFTVPADRSILEALRDAGVETLSSCESGTCGTCRCGLISGEADHRDMVLMEEEKGDQIMICVSRAAAGNLVLDL